MNYVSRDDSINAELMKAFWKALDKCKGFLNKIYFDIL